MDHTPRFAKPRTVFDGIEPRRFEQLETFAARHLPRLPLAAEAEELGLDLDACLAAVIDQRAFAADAAAAFAPFEGHWLGGDIRDSRRVYRHIWYPTEVEKADEADETDETDEAAGGFGGFAGQKVLMLDADGRATLAYDFCQLGPTPRVTGLVGARAHRGYCLPAGALLWLGEERDAQVSVHLERVHAHDQLYDVRGFVVDVGAGEAAIQARSDWRYHRLRSGAIRP